MPLDASEEFVPSNKGKLVNGECFESFLRELQIVCKQFKIE